MTYVISTILSIGLVLAGTPPPPASRSDGATVVTDKSGVPPVVATALLAARSSRGRTRKRGAVYARFSTKFQASIEDQVRACREWCEANDVELDEALIFVDRAISGKKSRRAGLEKLKAALNAGQIDVLVTFATNRLHRNSYKARQFIEEEVIENSVRLVALRSGVDSADEKKWRLLHSVNAIVDETMLSATGDAVRNAHAGGLLQNHITGRVTPGYTGKAIEGRLTRLQLPKREVIVDPATAPWVQKVYHWYLHENLSIIDIVARLKREGAPGNWSERVVRRMLSNERYIGLWCYGKTRTRWLNKKDYGLQEKQETPQAQAYFPDLRIIDDATFKAVQAKLAGRNRAAGRKTKHGQRRPRILNGLLSCALHDRPLNRGDGYFCPQCRGSSDADRLYSKISADVALRAICHKLAHVIGADADLVAQVVESFKRHAEAIQGPDLSRLPELQRQKEKLSRRIGALQLNLGDTDEDIAQSQAALREMRSQRAAVDSQITKLSDLANKPVRVPTDTEVEEVVDQLHEVLMFGAKGEAAADPQALRQVIELLTGGKIICRQAGEAKAKRGWIKGTFKVALVRAVVEKLGGDGPGGADEVEVDFADPTDAMSLAEPAKELYDQGLPVKLIAQRLVKPVNLIRTALDYWFESHGLKREDGRTRRSRLTVKHLEMPLYQKIAEQVHELAEQGLLFQKIARRLEVDRNTVTQAWKHWHVSRGMVAAKGQQRRKTLVVKTERKRASALNSDELRRRPAA